MRLAPATIAGLAGCALYLVLAVLSGLDRAGAQHPPLRAYVPLAAQSETLAARVRAFRDAAAPGSALGEAVLLVRRDPRGPDSTGLLGVARLAKGDVAGADAAFRASAAAGWRDPGTQVYWYQTALAAQDYPRAALRFSAVARQWPGAKAIDPLAAGLQATPDGETALVARLSAGEPWVAQFARPQPDEPADRIAARAGILTRAGANGTGLRCAQIADMAQTLVPSAPLRAAALFDAFCRRPGARTILFDGSFDQTDPHHRTTVFDWGLTGSGAVESGVKGSGPDRRVAARNDGTGWALVLEQALAATPGTFTVRFNRTGTARTWVALSCSTQASEARPVVTEDFGAQQRATVQFAGGCALPVLQVWLGSGSATIDDVTLEAA